MLLLLINPPCLEFILLLLFFPFLITFLRILAIVIHFKGFQYTLALFIWFPLQFSVFQRSSLFLLQRLLFVLWCQILFCLKVQRIFEPFLLQISRSLSIYLDSPSFPSKTSPYLFLLDLILLLLIVAFECLHWSSIKRQLQHLPSLFHILSSLPLKVFLAQPFAVADSKFKNAYLLMH